jgi:Transposase IS4
VKWINFVGPTSVDLGERISIDEQTMGFQGRHADKLRISYKTEGDGFQCEAMGQDGYTYVVYFRNVPAPSHYIKNGLSPLHARCLWMMSFLRDKGHRVHMDNLYLSAKFAKACFNHEMNVHIAGVTRKTGRGLPAGVLQEEVKNKRLQMTVRGTVKAAVLRGDKDCMDLVACSFYDTKPVHIISMVCDTIKWVEKTRLVYDSEQSKMVAMKFLRLNLNDDYNNDMGHVDVADQLRGNYRMDRWLRQYKWWWSIWLWGFGVLLVNAYIFYQKSMDEWGVPKRERLSHYEFRRRIALAWVSKDEPTMKQRRRANLPNPATIAGKRKAPPQQTSARSTRTKTADTRTVDSTPPSILAVDTANKESSCKKGKASAVTDLSLNTATGTFARRLDPTAGHWLTESPNRPKCALHRWACGNAMSYRLNVFYCTFCMVNLCIDCFRIFHSEPGQSLVDKKQIFADHFNKKQVAKRTSIGTSSEK